MIKIYEANERPAALVQDLLDVWEKSVRATHFFLSDNEVKNIKKYVPQALNAIAHLLVAEDKAGKPIAFMEWRMGRLKCFLLPRKKEAGAGEAEIHYGIENYGVERLAVNEQNPQAKGFYEHMGFQVYKRTDHDEQGNPYPLLYMSISQNPQENIP